MSNLLDADRREKMRQACLALRPSLSFEAHVDRLEEIYRSRRIFPSPGTRGEGKGGG